MKIKRNIGEKRNTTVWIERSMTRRLKKLRVRDVEQIWEGNSTAGL